MEQRDQFTLATPRLAYSSLPFSLSNVAPTPDPPLALVIDRLELLRTMAWDTRKDIDLLRRDSAEVLRLVTTSIAAAGAPARATREAPAEREMGLRVYLFGGFEIQAEGQSVTRWTSRKSRLLLAYLATNARQLVPKEVLIELFWPDCPLERGSNNLSIAIHHIRARLSELVPKGNHGVCVRQGLYGLDPDASCWVDVEEFRSKVSQGRASVQQGDRDATRRLLADATDLYRGDFLESDPYEEWTVDRRRALAEAYRWALAWLAADAAGESDWSGVLAYAEKILEKDPCDEEAHRWLIRAYLQVGRKSQALLQYRICSERLQDELGVSPSIETQNLLLGVNGG